MQRISPAIIPQSLEHLRESLETVSGFAKAVQVDIVDGVFVPSTSWPYTHDASPQSMKKVTSGFDIEMDLMVNAPEDVLEDYIKAGARSVVVHLESVINYNKIIGLKCTYDFSLGLSINNDTPLEMLLEYIGDADYVQLMGIAKIGVQGNPFDERVLDRIALVKKTYPDLEVRIDGSVNKKTLPKLCKAGASKFAVGSAILQAKNPKDMYETLETLVEKNLL